MNSGWHLLVSFIKSGIRILSCIISWRKNSIKVLAMGLGLAELLGVVEELGDKR